MTKKTEEDPRAIARSYIEAAVKLQGTRQPPAEVYERAVADAEQAFRGLLRARRKTLVPSN